MATAGMEADAENIRKLDNTLWPLAKPSERLKLREPPTFVLVPKMLPMGLLCLALA